MQIVEEKKKFKKNPHNYAMVKSNMLKQKVILAMIPSIYKIIIKYMTINMLFGNSVFECSLGIIIIIG